MSTAWTVEGVLLCPECSLFIDYYGDPDELREFISAHDCSKPAAQERGPDR